MKSDEIGDAFSRLSLQLQASLAPVILWFGRAFLGTVNRVQKEIAFQATYWMARMQGVGHDTAKTGANELLTEWDDEQAKIAEQARAQVEAARDRGKGGSDTVKAEKTAKETATANNLAAQFTQGIQLTSLQQIGAKVSFSPMQSAIQQNTQALKENTAIQKAKPAPGSYDALTGVTY